MNDPIADRIPFFRQDYEQLKREYLWAREDVLLAVNCTRDNCFGYTIITTERLITVLFVAETGLFSPSRERVRDKNLVYIYYYFTPSSPLTSKELKSRWIHEIPLNTILGVQRYERKESLHGKPLIRMHVHALGNLSDTLYFYDTQDAQKVHELLGTASTRVNISTNQPSASGSAAPDLIEALAKLHASGVITEQEYQTKKKDLLARM